MHGVHSHVDRSLGAGEVVKAHATLRRKVPHTGIAVNGERRRTRIARRKLACRVDKPARALEPGLNHAAIL